MCAEGPGNLCGPYDDECGIGLICVHYEEGVSEEDLPLFCELSPTSKLYVGGPPPQDHDYDMI